MTFGLIETSKDDAKPVELLLVSYMTNHWAHTNGDTDFTHDGRNYSPMPFEHTALKQTGDVAKTTLTLRVPQDAQFGELFRVQPPTGVVGVTLFVSHYGDNDVKAFWKGKIVNAEWEQPWLTLTVENAYSSLKRLGLRRVYSTQCPHPLYSQGLGLCNVNEASHRITATVNSINGLTINCNTVGLGVNFLAGGKVTWVHQTAGYTEGRMITSSDQFGNFNVPTIPLGLSVGQQVTIVPGCDHSLEACHAKFNNALNFGGMEHIPRKNPFAGTSMY